MRILLPEQQRFTDFGICQRGRTNCGLARAQGRVGVGPENSKKGLQAGQNTGQLKMDFRFVRPGGECADDPGLAVQMSEDLSGRRPFRILGAAWTSTEQRGNSRAIQACDAWTK